MSLLEFLLDEEISDSELLWEVEWLEAEYLMTDVSDFELLRDMEAIEKDLLWNEMGNSEYKITDSQCMHTVEHAEEQFFDQFDVSNLQLLRDVTVLES